MTSKSFLPLLLLAILLCSVWCEVSSTKNSYAPKMLSLEEFIKFAVPKHDRKDEWIDAVKVAFMGPNYAETKEISSLSSQVSTRRYRSTS